ncbi:MAG: M23 family metallopeptidase [Actinomycetota bacterium]|nr:M23 family metallopeptidase [Actinomycetota bacterium]
MTIRHTPAACLAAVLLLLGLSLDAFAGSPTSSGATQQAQSWTWPLQPAPEVTAYFDPPSTPYGPGHLGVDLLGHPGQSVHATAAGTVSFAGQVAGKPVVVVDHGQERSTYEPVVAGVRRGDQVMTGQPIGTLVLMAGHCLPFACLHLGRRMDDTYLDPLHLLGGGPVRLLPRDTAMPVPASPDPPARYHTPILTPPPSLAPGPTAMLASTVVVVVMNGLEATRLARGRARASGLPLVQRPQARGWASVYA